MALNSDIKSLSAHAVPTITTTSQMNGAIAMFYPGVKERLAELFGGDYYVAFTSVSLRVYCPHLLLLLFMQVFIPYGYSDHASPSSACAMRVQKHVLQGMGLIALHAAHLSKLMRLLMGTSMRS